MRSQLDPAKIQLELQHQLTLCQLHRLEQSIQEYGPSLDHRQRKRNLNEKLERLTQAQERIHSGTYGICTRCRKMIEPERMEIVPDTTMCAGCVQKALHAHARAKPAKR